MCRFSGSASVATCSGNRPRASGRARTLSRPRGGQRHRRAAPPAITSAAAPRRTCAGLPRRSPLPERCSSSLKARLPQGQSWGSSPASGVCSALFEVLRHQLKTVELQGVYEARAREQRGGVWVKGREAQGGVQPVGCGQICFLPCAGETRVL